MAVKKTIADPHKIITAVPIFPFTRDSSFDVNCEGIIGCASLFLSSLFGRQFLKKNFSHLGNGSCLGRFQFSLSRFFQLARMQTCNCEKVLSSSFSILTSPQNATTLAKTIVTAEIDPQCDGVISCDID